MAARLPTLGAALALALAGCGDTLIDHRAVVDILSDPATCGDGQVVCGSVCTTQSTAVCGASCSPCPAAPPDATGTCTPTGPGGHDGVCGYECIGGLLKCAAGCCRAAKIAAGDAHTCAIAVGGALSCWGANGSHQVAADDVPAVTAPHELYDSLVIDVALGAAHTCAIIGESVSCWGRNLEGQAPALVPITGATRLAAGLAHTCAIVSGGAVQCWGSNLLGQRGGAGTGTPAVAKPISSGAIAVAAGYDHTCALLAGGTVRCWGSRSSGQLGDGAAAVPGAFSQDPVPAASLTSATAVSASRAHSCSAQPSSSATPIDPAVQCWGDQPGTTFLLASQQLAPAVPRRRADKAVVEFGVTAIVTGRTHVCVQREAEFAYCFGPDNSVGQLGGTTPPENQAVQIGQTVGALGIAAGADHACAILADGTIRCWGLNDAGQLGDGTTTTPPVGEHRPVAGL